MSNLVLNAGFLPLVDAAPLIVARDLGFAEEEGLELRLHKSPSWSALRDMLVLGRIDAAQMLAPVPVAMALGLGGTRARLDVLMVLSVNGDVIGVSNRLARRIRATGHGFDFQDATAARRALIAACPDGARIGVPFPFSMHAELLHRWLGGPGDAPLPTGFSVRTVPPPLMAATLAEGEVDAFCVGEPWGSVAVEGGAGELLLPGAAIWGFAPEKVLAVRSGWADAHPGVARRLMRAVWRAAKWLDVPHNRTSASEILSRPDQLDVSAEVIERGLSGKLVISGRGDLRTVPNHLVFADGTASFPWRSQAAWIAARLAGRLHLDLTKAVHAAESVFRSDLYRANLRDLGADLPGASARLEGGLSSPACVSGERRDLILPADRFFDGHVFDPDALA